jgi:hypothetical protein
MTTPTRSAPWLLARFAQGAIAGAAVADVCHALAETEHHLHPTNVSLAEAAYATMIFFYLMMAAIVLFLVWLGRCRRNAQTLSPKAPITTGAWAVGAWFTPLVNFWVPRGFVLEIGRATSPTWEKGRNTTLVNAWWVAFAVHTFMTLVRVPADTDAMVIATLQTVITALDVAAAVLVILLIERITALQGAALQCRAPAAPVAHP